MSYFIHSGVEFFYSKFARKAKNDLLGGNIRVEKKMMQKLVGSFSLGSVTQTAAVKIKPGRGTLCACGGRKQLRINVLFRRGLLSSPTSHGELCVGNWVTGPRRVCARVSGADSRVVFVAQSVRETRSYRTPVRKTHRWARERERGEWKRTVWGTPGTGTRDRGETAGGRESDGGTGAEGVASCSSALASRDRPEYSRRISSVSLCCTLDDVTIKLNVVTRLNTLFPL